MDTLHTGSLLGSPPLEGQLQLFDAPDEQICTMWLHGRSIHTQRAYRRDVELMLAGVGKPLRAITLSDLQGYADTLAGEPATNARKLAAVKSLFGFAHRIGALQFDVARPLRLPPVPDKRAQRIISERDVLLMIDKEPSKRNRVMMLVMYAAGLRVSEVVALRWGHLAARDEGRGQLTTFGKGGKTRHILLPREVWGPLMAWRKEDVEMDISVIEVGDLAEGARLRKQIPDIPVFPSRKGGGWEAITTRQVARIVDAAARRQGIETHVSPHFLRHAHASHSMDRGAPIELVRQTLGHASIATTGVYLHARPSDSSGRFLNL